MTTLKDRRRVIDKLGREWSVLAEWMDWLWLAPKPPDSKGPWTVSKGEVRERE